MIFALIVNSLVANIGTFVQAPSMPGFWVRIDTRNPRPGLGWVYDAGNDSFTPPAAAQTAPDAGAWHIAVGPFFDRFGALKLPILASTDAEVRALVLDASVRKFIDLSGRRDEIEAALNLLIAKGFAVNKAAILDTQPTVAERP